MKHSIVVCAAALLFTTHAVAGEKGQPPEGGMDMSKMGPWTRKPKNEKKIKKEIAGLFKTMDALSKKGDFETALEYMDFPVFMMTDDAKGVTTADLWDQARYTKEMKPFWDGAGKNMKMKHKPTVTVLSDAMVSVVDNFTMTMGKKKLSGKNIAVLVKKDGKWKYKVMGEAGWGGMPAGSDTN